MKKQKLISADEAQELYKDGYAVDVCTEGCGWLRCLSLPPKYWEDAPTFRVGAPHLKVNNVRHVAYHSANFKYKTPKDKNLLINNKQFILDCNYCRDSFLTHYKAKGRIELYNSTRQFLLDIDETINKYKHLGATQSIILGAIGVNSAVVGRWRSEYSMKLSNTSKGSSTNSLLNERVHFAKLIIAKKLTTYDVCKKSGYKYQTVRTWVRDYKKFGDKMLSQAIAFRREL